jgi:hypothetical protein
MMKGHLFLMDTSPEALGAKLAREWDKIVADALRAAGVTWTDPEELRGRLDRKRHVDDPEGQWRYYVDNRHFLTMAEQFTGSGAVRVAWVTHAC